jgi:RNA polymerase sigma-70 factor (ECF subfamily)
MSKAASAGTLNLRNRTSPSPRVMDLPQIYEQHADFVWRTVRRLGVAEAEAGDAVQDVFLLVHAHLSEFEGRSSLKTWLFAISRSVARQRRMSARRAPALYAEGGVDDALDLRADVARGAEHNEKVALLAAILMPLPPEQRNVFILFEIEEWTGQEISEALTIPIGTVYSRLELARKAFRAGLQRRAARERFVPRRAGGAP